MHDRKFRIELDSLGVVGDGPIGIVGLEVDDTPAEIEPGLLWVQPDRLGVIGQGLVKFAFRRLVDESALAIRIGILGIEPDDRREVGDGLVGVTLPEIGVGPEEIGPDVLGIEPDGLVEIGQGLVDVAFALVTRCPGRSRPVRISGRAEWRR